LCVLDALHLEALHRIVFSDADATWSVVCLARAAAAAPKPPTRTAPTDASSIIRAATSKLSPRSVIACILLHRDDRAAFKACSKHQLHDVA
jgi:hypothetical protein